MKFRLNQKLIMLFTFFIAIPILILTFVTYLNNRKALTEKAYEKLVSVREAKAAQIENLFETMGKQAQTLGTDPMVINSFLEFKNGYSGLKAQNKIPMDEMKKSVRDYYLNQFGKEYESKNKKNYAENLEKYLSELPLETIKLQYHYIGQNKSPLGSKHQLDDAEDGSMWSKTHLSRHPFFRQFIDTFGYYDLFLVDLEDGQVLYTVFKELDFATNLQKGPYRETNLAGLFQKLKANSGTEYFTSDLKEYAPSYDLPAGFVGAPIVQKGKKIGLIIFQVPVEKIDTILTANKKWEESGFGKTGEVILTGDDLKYRSLSRGFVENQEQYLKNLRKISFDEKLIHQMVNNATTALLHSVRSDEVNLNEHTTTSDFRCQTVLIASKKLNIAGLNWVISSRVDESEALQSIQELLLRTILIAGALLILGFFIARHYAKNITEPIIDAGVAVQNIAKGNLAGRVDAKTNDEVGEMAQSINDAIQKISTAFGSKQINWVSLEEAKRAELEAKEKAEQARIEVESALEKVKEEQKVAQQSLVLAQKATAEAKESEIKANAALQQAEDEKQKAMLASKQVADMLSAQETESKLLIEKVRSILNVVNKATEGDLTEEMNVSGSDPIGQVGNGLKNFFDRIRKNLNEIDIASMSLKEATENLTRNSATLKQNAKETDSKTQDANQASHDINQNMGVVNKNMEELVLAVREITTRTTNASKLANEASQKSSATENIMNQLSESSNGIGSVIKLISTIAEQTNLLALNATIEAARAGDAGKGFAVVANEVKELAKQTAVATEGITNRINQIQTDTASAIEAINAISKAIFHVNENTNSIAAAIEEQASATSHISSTLGMTTQKVEMITKSIYQVKESSQNTNHAVEDSYTSIAEMEKLSQQLSELVGYFKLNKSSYNKAA